MDESIDAGTVEDDYLPTARDVVAITGVTNWPADHQTGATGVQDAAGALVDALDAGDTAAAKQPATDLHDARHDEHEAVAFTAAGSDLPPQAGLEEEHNGGGAHNTESTEATTPEADETATQGDDHSE